MGTKEECARVVRYRGYAYALTPLHSELGVCITCSLPVWGNAPQVSTNGEYHRWEYVHYSCRG
jgi:hypothetical protein